MLMRRGFDAMSRLNKIDHVINTETKAISQCASQMAKWGVGGRKRLLHTARERVADEVQMYLPVFKGRVNQDNILFCYRSIPATLLAKLTKGIGI